jgi:polyribonucleotide nucleotidyltransferase
LEGAAEADEPEPRRDCAIASPFPGASDRINEAMAEEWAEFASVAAEPWLAAPEPASVGPAASDAPVTPRLSPAAQAAAQAASIAAASAALAHTLPPRLYPMQPQYATPIRIASRAPALHAADSGLPAAAADGGLVEGEAVAWLEGATADGASAPSAPPYMSLSDLLAAGSQSPLQLLGAADPGQHATTVISREFAGRTLSLEVGRIGPLADGVVYAKYGNTSLLATAVSKWDASSAGFLPLQVDYREKAFAVGVIPSTFTRREGNVSDREVLSARVVDRSVRPMFDKGFVVDTQVIVSLLSLDKDADPQMLAIVASSAALHASNIPWNGPVAAVRVGWVDGAPVVAPTYEQDSASQLNLLYAGSQDKCIMLEAGAHQLPEGDFVRALRAAHAALQPLLELQDVLKRLAGKDKKPLPLQTVPDKVLDFVRGVAFEDAREIFRQHGFKKQQRGNAQRLLFIKIREALDQAGLETKYTSVAGDTVMKAALRSLVVDAAAASTPAAVNPFTGQVLAAIGRVEGEAKAEATTAVVPSAPPSSDDGLLAQYNVFDGENCRPDGRSTTQIREIKCDINVLPSAHGSSVFSRGDTQVVCTATLGPVSQAQLVRPMGGNVTNRKAFFLHYDFPPYCTNETGRVGGANRRMVGHGALAERALAAVMPSEEEYPFTVRVTSEVAGSDGSSSMATVCGATMALMDAGVPIKTPVAGISIGSFCPKEKDFAPGSRLHLLTDIFGLEDHAGDMDFKVAGSATGITALQLDVKPAGLPLEVLEQALWRARAARLKVLDKMLAVLPGPRAEDDLRANVLRSEQFTIPPEALGRLIGPGGTNLRRIETTTGARLAFENDTAGLGKASLTIYGLKESLEMAKSLVAAFLEEQRRVTGNPLSFLMSSSTPALTIGECQRVRLRKLLEFGAILEKDGHEVGYIHIGEMSSRRTLKMTDLVSEGDEITAMVADVDVRGKGKFSIRVMLRPDEEPTKYIHRIASSDTEPAVAAPTIAASPSVAVPAASSGAATRSSPENEATAPLAHATSEKPAADILAAGSPDKKENSADVMAARQPVIAAVEDQRKDVLGRDQASATKLSASSPVPSASAASDAVKEEPTPAAIAEMVSGYAAAATIAQDTAGNHNLMVASSLFTRDHLGFLFDMSPLGRIPMYVNPVRPQSPADMDIHAATASTSSDHRYLQGQHRNQNSYASKNRNSNHGEYPRRNDQRRTSDNNGMNPKNIGNNAYALKNGHTGNGDKNSNGSSSNYGRFQQQQQRRHQSQATQ